MEAVAHALPEIEFELKTARSGDPSLSIGGRLVHGLYDPERDARRDAARLVGRAGRDAPIALLGAGLGLLPRAIRSLGVRDLLVFEPFPRLWGALPKALRGPRPDAFTPAELAAALQRRPANVVVHPGYEDLVRFEQRFAHWALRRRLGAHVRGEFVGSERSFAALQRLPRLRTLPSLEGCLRGRSVVIASGGPSLDEVVPVLARAGSVVLAAPQALDRLIAAGVRVDFVVSPDPGDWLTPVLGPRGAPFGALLADTSTHPEILDRCPERCFLFQLRSRHLHQLAWERAGLPVVDEPMLTVSETAFHLARQLGAQRVLLAGVDFDAPNPLYGSPFRARTLRNELAPTNRTYFHAARYLSHLLPSLPDVAVGRVGNGLFIDGARPLGPDDVEAWLREDGPQAGVPPALPMSDRGAERLRVEVERWLNQDPPMTTERYVTPIRHEAWAGFEPMTPTQVAVRWRSLREGFARGAP